MTRPLVNIDGNVREMTDKEYIAYLEDKLEFKLSDLPPEERLDFIEPKVKDNSTQVEDLTCLLADMIGGLV